MSDFIAHFYFFDRASEIGAEGANAYTSAYWCTVE